MSITLEVVYHPAAALRRCQALGRRLAAISKGGLLPTPRPCAWHRLEPDSRGLCRLADEKDGERSPNQRVMVDPSGAAEAATLTLGERDDQGRVRVQVLRENGDVAPGALVFLETAEGAQ